MRSRPPDLYCKVCRKYVGLIGIDHSPPPIHCKLTVEDGEILIDQLKLDPEDFSFVFVCENCNTILANDLEDLTKKYAKR